MQVRESQGILQVVRPERRSWLPFTVLEFILRFAGLQIPDRPAFPGFDFQATTMHTDRMSEATRFRLEQI
jgi:hypothetical protein